MENSHNRRRVLYIRVTDSELVRYRDLCEQNGARNMSDLVRCAVESMSRERDPSFEQEVTQRLRQLEASLASLRQAVEQITEGRFA
jgi:hypothetical protein